ncbi:hypothetical protein TGAM01_v210884 [Trichoderma gamsii]|uniref:Uncharacterized protein n=1 Tax=Trichoderma gamsii TaxID=398673 RepID=A0A2P4Z7I1_9HYPO|nr:hypothetical protein TGAM01_v210884 [Trichoderma gamsii]PON20242.1 hypothetical protein TGAM01_v210884 [Trichoderma gamsii]
MGRPNLRRRAPIGEKLDDIDRNSPPRESLRVPSSDSLDAGYLTTVPDSRCALLVNVLQIAHKDHKIHKLNKDPEETKSLPSKKFSTKGRCIITISRLRPNKTQLAYCETQVCDVIASNNTAGPHRVIYIVLPRPFFICEENIFINRTADGNFGLPEPYSLRLELEASYNQYWPPSGVDNCGTSAPSPPLFSIYGEESVLSNQFNQISGRHFLSSFTITREVLVPTDYTMEIDVIQTSRET